MMRALDRRAWICRTKSPEQVLARLRKRIDVFDEALVPWRDKLDQVHRGLVEAGLLASLQRADQPLDDFLRAAVERWLTNIALPWACRLAGERMVAAFYAKRRGFPRIEWGDYPWRLDVDRLHPLELTPREIRRPLASPPKELMAKHLVISPPGPEPVGGPEQIGEIVEALIAESRLLGGARAWQGLPLMRETFNRLVDRTRPTAPRAERQAAERDLRRLVDQGLSPDHRREGTRTRDQFQKFVADYHEINTKIQPLHAELTRTGSTIGLLARWQDILRDGRLETGDLNRFRAKPLHAVVLELLWRYRERRGVSELRPTSLKTFRDLWRDAVVANEIDDRWAEFVKDIWLTLPATEQRALFPRLEPLSLLK